MKCLRQYFSFNHPVCQATYIYIHYWFLALVTVAYETSKNLIDYGHSLLPTLPPPFILILGCDTSKNSNIREWQVVVTQSKEKLIEEKKYIWFSTMYVVYVENKCIKHVLLYHLVVPVPARWIITQSLSLF